MGAVSNWHLQGKTRQALPIRCDLPPVTVWGICAGALRKLAANANGKPLLMKVLA
jgi:hypothetical protein